MVSCHDHGGGVFSIQVMQGERRNALSAQLTRQLMDALDAVRAAASLKVLILKGTSCEFLCGGRTDSNEALGRGLYRAIASFPVPVIAAMQGDASGAGFLVGALCDFMVCSRSASYRYCQLEEGQPEEGLFPTAEEDRLFSERFGRVRATDILYLSLCSTGGQLQEKGWSCPIVPAEQVESYAHALAASLARKSQSSLRLLKEHLARGLLERTESLTPAEPVKRERHHDESECEAWIPSELVRVENPAEGVLLLKICDAEQGCEASAVVDHLNAVFGKINQHAANENAKYRTIVLVSEHADFLPQAAGEGSADAVSSLQRVLRKSSLPVVAVLNSTTSGRGWLIGQFCDAAIYAREGRYCAADLLRTPIAELAVQTFSSRFGAHAGRDIALAGAAYSGADLQRCIGPLPVAAQDQVMAEALKLARSWAEFPPDTIASWRKHSAIGVAEDGDSLLSALESDTGHLTADGGQAAAGTSRPIVLESKVISATAHPGGIVVVTMEDRESKNLFSEQFVRGMKEVFTHIDESVDYKVVILAGYDKYFACGGTKEALVAIQEGRARFTDDKTYELALDCKIPVIAAMQGHGIGGGLSLGLFADFVLLSEESKYVSPYMGYGFTPGGGATLIVPEKLGVDLARETLLTAQEYAGSELGGRRVPLPVYSRKQIHEAAMSLAQRIARHPRGSLIWMKRYLNRSIRERLERNTRYEIAMHERTFVGQADTLNQIQTSFNPMDDTTKAVAATPVVDPLPAVAAELKQLLAQELHMQVADIDEDTQFIDLGLDSITGVTWMRKINERYGTSIQATKVYGFPTLSKLSAYITEEVRKLDPAPGADGVRNPVVCSAPAAPAPEPQPGSGLRFSGKPRSKLASWRDQRASRISGGVVASQPIAVIGMAGQFPKARTLDEYWENIAQGRNCISEIPPSRWDINAYYQQESGVPGKTNGKWMGLLDEYDLFDPLFFEISPKEAISMDPQQRVFLQACWHAIESAGFNPRALSGGKCGVFVGCGPSDYHLQSRDLQISALGFTGADTSILAARVSYFLDLQGPCLSIQTACSSSMVAIATACDSLVSGQSDLALAGGVCVLAGPEMHVRTAQTGMLSKDGRCFTFDQRANGFVPGEGVGAVLLKRLSEAEKDHDIILGVIEGWGVNQDGKTNGITAPNPQSQTRLQQEVYDKYRIDPAGIQLIEAHGTGTKLGDPIEVDALKQSFGKYTQRTGYCALGSVKTNIGHCFTAAGLASTLKVLLALQHRQLPPTINFERLNEHISLKGSPFYVNDRLRDWEAQGPQRRRAAISGFGFGGTNAHIVIAEYSAPSVARPPVSVLRETGKVIVPLSARTEDQLRRKAADLLDFLSGKGRSADLLSTAYTLQVGREPMEVRWGVLADSIEELRSKLRAYLRDEGAREGIYEGRVSESKEAMSLIRSDDVVQQTIIERLIAQRKLAKLLELWVKGLAFDWHSLYGDSKPQRIGLPLYPFARERYWVDSVETVREARQKRVTSALHPLLHRNTSNFTQHGFSSTLRGDESFLAGSEPDGVKALPGAAYLEMARAAVVQVASGEEPVVVELRDIAWAEPFRVTDEKDISIALFPDADETIEFEIYSGQGGEDIVHCQGRAVVTPRSAQIRLDLGKLEEQMIEDGAEQLLTQLDLPGAGAGGDSDCALHPGSVDGVLQAWADFKEPGQALSPVALRQVRVIAGCPREIFAWVRCSTTGQSDVQHTTLDVDLCDAKGNVCVEIRELSAQRLTAARQQTSVASISTAAEPTTGPVAEEREAASISHARLLQELKASLARALYLSTSDISVDRPFIELGLDSIVGVEWVGEVNKTYNLKLTATKTYDYPNITELASYIETELKKSFVPPAKKTRAAVVDKSTVPAAKTACASLKRKDRAGRAGPRSNAPPADKIAVIGMSGRYPEAGNLGQFWENLARGRSSITEVPPSRWDVSQYYDPNPARADKIYCKWLGALEEVDCFDPLFFRISPAEAKGMDPQHRLFLEESYKAFEDAGYSGKALSHKKCGVYLGAIGNEYSSVISQGGSVPGDLTGNSFAIGAARIAYFLNLKGPAISIDTACSSSLVAIHLACQGLLNHETDMALAGGVTVYLKPDSYFGMCQAGMLSADGRCKTFDDSANGFVPGEGVGVVVLKRLQDALRDRDRIYGVILGSGINQDGKTNGITAPSVNSQIELGRELYARYKIDPETISYVEAHGTGTKLGDPIELEALSTVFKEKTSKQNYCALGSVKSNIGHTSGAAGVASVQKVLLCMQHRTLVPSLNVTKENSLFDFASSPFYVSKETRSWNAGSGSPRRAGVSSFGFSGTNAHLVLEEYLPPPMAHAAASVASPDSGVMILLSARTPDQLRQKATDFLQFLRSDDPGKSKDLMAIAYTLFTGRDVMDERAGFLVHSVDELVEKLQAYIGGHRVSGVCQGRVVRGDDGVLIERENEMTKDLLELLGLWVRGLELDWHAVYGDAKQQRVALPGYPFARKRYWVDTATGQPPAETKAEVQVLHPLLHRNSSILGQHGYSSTFTGAEPFLIDPGLTELPVGGAGVRKVLPAMAYLEMARAALQKAVPAACDSAYPQLRDIVWGRPLLATRSRQVNIALFRKSEEQVDFEIYSLDQESESPAQEIVHAQGHAVFQRKPARTRLDMDKLRTQRGDRHLLAELRLPAEALASRNDYLLHPSLLDAALHASSAILGKQLRSPGHPSLPFALDVLRIESACAAEMYAWIRLSQHSPQNQAVVKLDIDLCDRQGQVCVALRGLAYEGMAHKGLPYEGLTQEQPRGGVPAAARKPTAISLVAAAEGTPDRKPRQIAVVTLESPVASATARRADEA